MIAEIDALLDPIWAALEADLTEAFNRLFANIESKRDEEVEQLRARIRELDYQVRCLAHD